MFLVNSALILNEWLHGSCSSCLKKYEMLEYICTSKIMFMELFVGSVMRESEKRETSWDGDGARGSRVLAPRKRKKRCYAWRKRLKDLYSGTSYFLGEKYTSTCLFLCPEINGRDNFPWVPLSLNPNRHPCNALLIYIKYISCVLVFPPSTLAGTWPYMVLSNFFDPPIILIKALYFLK